MFFSQVRKKLNDSNKIRYNNKEETISSYPISKIDRKEMSDEKRLHTYRCDS